MKRYFVEYKIAKLLKELGFKMPCIAYYFNKKFSLNVYPFENGRSIWIACPTYDQVKDWLFTQGYLIQDFYFLDKKKWTAYVYNMKKDFMWSEFTQNNTTRDTRKSALYYAYLEAIRLIKASKEGYKVRLDDPQPASRGNRLTY